MLLTIAETKSPQARKSRDGVFSLELFKLRVGGRDTGLVRSGSESMLIIRFVEKRSLVD